ncbi:NAD(P)/FAD-dependent oxidoreductase [Porcipelethomonas sp.]|uniref:NAD(P)/FAD-dependent oxidoreductase n=1 Tax=Porcipelethomonas sp. TaxID=2981675 RepID=UPI003EF62521
MPVIVNQIKGKLDENQESIIKKALKYAGITRKDVINCGINKVSLDARHNDNIHFVYSVFIKAESDELEKKICRKSGCRYVAGSSFNPEISGKKKNGDIVIAGFGPAGMFCGLVLAEYGYRPVIIERGQSVDRRIKDVADYWSGGRLNTQSNVQFGEGGAGTFSDGKLTTRINDPLCRYVLEKFVEFGAPDEILIKAKPHIGTDNLRSIVKSIRERIISLGGKILFDSRLDDINLKNGKIESVTYNENETKVSALVLAIGHSARDTFSLLLNKGIFMESKPFSIGVRIEHKQEEVNRSLYGKYAGNPNLPAGEYQLSYRRPDGRCVYTFCMCPGGHVVPAASEENTVVTNGMSLFARNGDNANAAMVVSVSSSDFGNGVLDGVDFARSVERRAFECAERKNDAPATTVNGFINGSPSVKSDIIPTYDRGVFPCDFNRIFPEFVTSMLAEGLDKFSHKMKCFGNKNALMTAPETRTSSPVRITRTENLNSVSAENLFPCGEGAGYAGGIMSAAVDGIKTAMAIMKIFSPY